MASARTVRIDILGDSKSAQKAFGDAEKSSESFGKKMADIGKIAAGFVVGQALTNLPGILIGGANAAIALEANARKAATVFGTSLGTVEAWADSAAGGMGLTNQQAVTLAASMADLLIPMGFTREAAAKMSTDVLGLAGALSEWSGGQKSAAEVSEILNAALLGERDGLKALGISISEADVSGRLLAKGQQDLTGAALEQAKAEATLELIFEKSTDAQTAYANSTNDLASRKAALIAKVNTLKERFQMALLPVMTIAFGIFEKLAGIAQTVGTAFDNFAKYVRAVAEDGDTLNDWLSHLPEGVQGAALAVGKLVAAFGDDGLKGVLLALPETLMNAASAIGEMALSLGGAILDGIIAGFDTAVDFGGRVAAFISEQVAGVDWGGAASGAGTAILDGIIAGWEAATGFGGRFVDWFVGQVTAIDYKGTGAAILDGIVAGWEATLKFGERFVNWFMTTFEGIEWMALGQKILDGIITGFKAVTGWGQTAIDTIVTFFDKVEWQALGQKILDGIITGAKAVAGWGQTFIDTIITFFEKVEWKALGEAILKGILDGMKQVTEWGQNAIDWIALQLEEGDWSNVGKTITEKLNTALGAEEGETSAVVELMRPVFDMLAGEWTTIVNNFAGIWENLHTIIDGVGEALGIDGLLSKAVYAMIGALGLLGAAILVLPFSYFTDMINTATSNIEGLTGALATATTFLLNNFGPAWDTVSNTVRRVWDFATGIPGIVSGGINSVSETLGSVMSSIQGAWNTVWDGMLGKVTTVINSAKSIVSGLINGVNSVIGGINSALDFSVGPWDMPGPIPDIPGVSFNSPDLPYVSNPFGGSNANALQATQASLPGGPGGGGYIGGPIQGPINPPPFNGGTPGGPGGPGGTKPVDGGTVVENPDGSVTYYPPTGNLSGGGISRGSGGGKGGGGNPFSGEKRYTTTPTGTQPDSLGRLPGDPCWGQMADCEARLGIPPTVPSGLPSYQGGGYAGYGSTVRPGDAAYAAKHGAVMTSTGEYAHLQNAGGNVFLDGFKVGTFLGFRHRRQAFSLRDPAGSAC